MDYFIKTAGFDLLEGLQKAQRRHFEQHLKKSKVDPNVSSNEHQKVARAYDKANYKYNSTVKHDVSNPGNPSLKRVDVLGNVMSGELPHFAPHRGHSGSEGYHYLERKKTFWRQ